MLKHDEFTYDVTIPLRDAKGNLVCDLPAQAVIRQEFEDDGGWELMRWLIGDDEVEVHAGNSRELDPVINVLRGAAEADWARHRGSYEWDIDHMIARMDRDAADEYAQRRACGGA